VTRSERTDGEQLAVEAEQAQRRAGQQVEGIDTATSNVNPDSGVDTTPHPTLDAQGGSEQGGMAGPVGQFEGEGNEGGIAPLGGDTTKSAEDGETNSQGGVASGAPG
jgi:hypothetical protein